MDSVEYFCYISESKVNNLLHQIDDHVIDALSEETVVEKSKSANPGLSGVIQLLSLSISFGKSQRIVTSRSKSEALAQKLKRVLKHLVSTNEIEDLRTVISQASGFCKVFYSYTGRFKVVAYDHNYAHIESAVIDDMVLSLVCSMKYFSDIGEHSGSYAPHSGNQLFFEGGVMPTFKTLVIVQDHSGQRILGTPLYLALCPINELDI